MTESELGNLIRTTSPDPLVFEWLDANRRRVLEPEKRLILAILEDAIAQLQKYVNARDFKGKKQFREAEEWVLEESSDYLFSFNNVCGYLGYDPSYFRQGLLMWEKIQKSNSRSYK